MKNFYKTIWDIFSTFLKLVVAEIADMFSHRELTIPQASDPSWPHKT